MIKNAITEAYESLAADYPCAPGRIYLYTVFAGCTMTILSAGPFAFFVIAVMLTVTNWRLLGNLDKIMKSAGLAVTLEGVLILSWIGGYAGFTVSGASDWDLLAAASLSVVMVSALYLVLSMPEQSQAYTKWQDVHPFSTNPFTEKLGCKFLFQVWVLSVTLTVVTFMVAYVGIQLLDIKPFRSEAAGRQASSTAVQLFEREGISFVYPSEWVEIVDEAELEGCELSSVRCIGVFSDTVTNDSISVRLYEDYSGYSALNFANGYLRGVDKSDIIKAPERHPIAGWEGTELILKDDAGVVYTIVVLHLDGAYLEFTLMQRLSRSKIAATRIDFDALVNSIQINK